MLGLDLSFNSWIDTGKKDKERENDGESDLDSLRLFHLVFSCSEFCCSFQYSGQTPEIVQFLKKDSYKSTDFI